jgi:glycosyltransferase involved in cell wall biosynthesis
LKSKNFLKKANELRQKKQYDLIHFDTISLLPYFKLFSGIPKVLDHHNIESHMLIRRAENEKNILKKLYFFQEGYRLQRVEKTNCALFNLNITCSKTDSERLSRIVPNATVVEIPNGVDTEYFQRKKSETFDNKLIFVGTLGWYPNAEAVTFIAEKLWDRLSKALPDISIDIIGSNPPQSVLDASRKYSNFKVHGYVDDVRPFMNSAALYICPIRDGGGTKLKLLDAFAMGMVVVAHPIACEGIDVEPDKNVIFATTPEEYTQKIIFLLKNKTKREYIGANARKLVEKFYSYEIIGKKVCHEFEQCAKNTES